MKNLAITFGLFVFGCLNINAQSEAADSGGGDKMGTCKVTTTVGSRSTSKTIPSRSKESCDKQKGAVKSGKTTRTYRGPASTSLSTTARSRGYGSRHHGGCDSGAISKQRKRKTNQSTVKSKKTNPSKKRHYVSPAGDNR